MCFCCYKPRLPRSTTFPPFHILLQFDGIFDTATEAEPIIVIKITTTHNKLNEETKTVNHFILPPAIVVPVQGQK